jgi:hypothetical protein
MTILGYIKHIGIPVAALLLLYLLNPLNLTILLGYALVGIFLLFNLNKLPKLADKNFMLFLVFGITYTMFNYFGDHKGIQYLIIQAVFPCIFFALGTTMTPKRLSKTVLVQLLLLIGAAYSFTAVLSVIANLNEGGFAQVNRKIPQFWNKAPLKSTTVASYLIFNSVIPAILVANRKRFNLLSIVVWIAVYLVSLVASFRLGSRTLIVISAFSIILSLCYLISQQSLKQNIRLGALIVFIIGALVLFSPIDADSPIFSTLGHRLSSGGASESNATAGNRTQFWAEGFENLFKKPLGWKSSMHHHNLWLDMAKNGGLIPLLFFLIGNVHCYRYLRKIMKQKNKDLGVNVTFIVLFLSSFLLFFTEPVIDGNFFSIVLYSLHTGILVGYYKKMTQPT